MIFLVLGTDLHDYQRKVNDCNNADRDNSQCFTTRRLSFPYPTTQRNKRESNGKDDEPKQKIDRDANHRQSDPQESENNTRNNWQPPARSPRCSALNFNTHTQNPLTGHLLVSSA